jgi:hypothetical protein
MITSQVTSQQAAPAKTLILRFVPALMVLVRPGLALALQEKHNAY